MMRILLSNDDGIFAPGLAALREAVDDMGEITVAAPASPQSAAAHSITLTEPLTVETVDLSGVPWKGLSVDGRPADCVRLAIRSLLDEPADLVLSGINAGSNVGINVFYSGTVAAAAEAAMLGVPAVALSSGGPCETLDDFRPTARLARWVIEQLLPMGLTAGDLINVNIPDLSRDPVRGVRVVPQSTAGIEDVYHRGVSDDGRDTYRLGDEYSFNRGAGAGEQADTDVIRLSEGYITVTPLHVDMTNHDRLAVLMHHRWSAPPPTKP